MIRIITDRDFITTPIGMTTIRFIIILLRALKTPEIAFQVGQVAQENRWILIRRALPRFRFVRRWILDGLHRAQRLGLCRARCLDLLRALDRARDSFGISCCRKGQ